MSLLALNRLGWTRLASIVLLAGLSARIVLSALPAGGIRSPGVGAFLTFVLMAELLLGNAAGWATAGVCAAAGLGLVVAERSDIHLLLTDLVMTEMSGFDLAREAHRRCPALRVLCVSGYLDREHPEDAADRPLHFLQKPFSAEELVKKVRDVLGS